MSIAAQKTLVFWKKYVKKGNGKFLEISNAILWELIETIFSITLQVLKIYFTRVLVYIRS